MKKTIFISLLGSMFSLLSVDVGNFRYISNKYRPYFPGKQLSVQSQTLTQNKTDWCGVQTGILAAGAAVATMVPTDYQGYVRSAAITAGAVAGLGGMIISGKNEDKLYSLEHKRYSRTHQQFVQKLLNPNKEKEFERMTQLLNWNEAVVEEYDLISRYPKKEMPALHDHMKTRESHAINSLLITAASIAWGVWEVSKRHQGRLAAIQESDDAEVRRMNNRRASFQNAAGNMQHQNPQLPQNPPNQPQGNN